MPRLTSTWLLLALLLLLPASTHADGPAERVFPPGGQRGTTVTLTFPGMERVDSAALLVDGAGLKPLGPFLKGVGKVEIAADAEPGVRQLRLVGPKSATQPRPFAVGVFAEVLEREPNDTFETAQRLEHRLERHLRDGAAVGAPAAHSERLHPQVRRRGYLPGLPEEG
jgi:hypothetical protein